MLINAFPGGSEISIVTEEITKSTTWTVPAGVTQIHVMCFGGGGGGDYGEYANGGGGGYLAENTFAVTPGTQYAITIGTGGTGGKSGTSATNGGTTKFGALLSAMGGYSGGDSDHPACGGTGGGFVKGSGIGVGQYGGDGNRSTSYAHGGPSAIGGTGAQSGNNYAGGGGGGMNGGDGGNGNAYSYTDNSIHNVAMGGGGGGYGTKKLSGDGYYKTYSTASTGATGGKGYGAGGGAGGLSQNSGSGGKGAPGICIIKYFK